jgi:hypothetical protein
MENNQDSILYFENHKTYCGQKYVTTFPDEWILNELPDTGRQCNNCKFFGAWRGVIVGYCLNCAEYCYHYSRGFGFDSFAVEIIPEDTDPRKSATMTYLFTVDLEKVGDINENLEDTLENHEKLSKQKHDAVNAKLWQEFEQEQKQEQKEIYDSYYN